MDNPTHRPKGPPTMPWNIPYFTYLDARPINPRVHHPILFTEHMDSTTTVNWTAAIIFALAAITDWFDGFLARRLETNLRLWRIP